MKLDLDHFNANSDLVGTLQSYPSFGGNPSFFMNMNAQRNGAFATTSQSTSFTSSPDVATLGQPKPLQQLWTKSAAPSSSAPSSSAPDAPMKDTASKPHVLLTADLLTSMAHRLKGTLDMRNPHILARLAEEVVTKVHIYLVDRKKQNNDATRTAELDFISNNFRHSLNLWKTSVAKAARPTQPLSSDVKQDLPSYASRFFQDWIQQHKTAFQNQSGSSQTAVSAAAAAAVKGTTDDMPILMSHDDLTAMATEFGSALEMTNPNYMAEFAEVARANVAKYLNDGMKKNKESEQRILEFLSHNFSKSLLPWKITVTKKADPSYELYEDEKTLICNAALDFYQHWIKVHRKEFRNQTTPVVMSAEQLKAMGVSILFPFDYGNDAILAHSIHQAVVEIRARMKALKSSDVPDEKCFGRYMVNQFNVSLLPWSKQHAGQDTLNSNPLDDDKKTRERVENYAQQFTKKWETNLSIAFQNQSMKSQTGRSAASSSAQANVECQNTNETTFLNEKAAIDVDGNADADVNTQIKQTANNDTNMEAEDKGEANVAMSSLATSSAPDRALAPTPARPRNSAAEQSSTPVTSATFSAVMTVDDLSTLGYSVIDQSDRQNNDILTHSVDQCTRAVMQRFYALQSSIIPEEREFAEFIDDQIKFSLTPWWKAKVDNAYLNRHPLDEIDKKKVKSSAKKFAKQWIEKHLSAYPGDDASSEEDTDSDEPANAESNVDVEGKGKAKAVPSSPAPTAAQACSQAPTFGIPRNTVPLYIDGFNPAPQATASSWSNPAPAPTSAPTLMPQSKKQKDDAIMVNNDLTVATTASTPMSAPGWAPSLNSAQIKVAPTAQMLPSPQNASSSANIPHASDVVMSDDDEDLQDSIMSEDDADDDSVHVPMQGICVNIKAQRAKPLPKQKPVISGRVAKKSGVRRTSVAAALHATPCKKVSTPESDTGANQLPIKSSLRELLLQFVGFRTYQPTPLQRKRKYDGDGEHQPCDIKRPCIFDPKFGINHVANKDAELLSAMERLSISKSAPEASDMQKMVETCESTREPTRERELAMELFRPSRFKPLVPTYLVHFGYAVQQQSAAIQIRAQCNPVPITCSSLPTSTSSTPRSSSTSFSSNSTAKTTPPPACDDEDEEL